MVGSPGCGCIALTHIARILPGVSFPSRVVRSIIRIARSSAHIFEAFLIDRRFSEVDALLDADLVDGRDPSQQAPEGSRTGVPRGDQLVRALAGDGVRTAGRGHGRRRIHPSLTRVTRLVRHSRHEPVRPAARRARALPAGPQRARRLRRVLGRDARRPRGPPRPRPARYERVDTGLRSVETFDVTFPGFDGQPIRGWLQLPAGAGGPLPCVVTYVGYGGGRSLPADHLLWASAGYAHLVMDTRGQGSGWTPGDTPDAGAAGDPQAPGVMTRGIEDPAGYYYRRLMTDAVRAVDAAKAHPAVDPARIAVGGGSQGGGLALAVAGLRSDLRAAFMDVPFLCHYRRASEITDAAPYVELATLVPGPPRPGGRARSARSPTSTASTSRRGPARRPCSRWR